MDKIKEQTGIHFTLHDLRRTFITIAESLDISYYALKSLVNHKISNGGDVTAGYIIPNPERLRGPVQKIADYILAQAGVKGFGKVVKFSKDKVAKTM